MKILFLCTISVLSTVSCRKYDVDTESLKLYGEDLNSVLLRFRKSPDYLQILNVKLEETMDRYAHMSHQVAYFCHNEMKEKIYEILGAPSAPGPYNLKNDTAFRYFSRLLRSPYNNLGRNLRQEEEEEEDEKELPVDKLDHYPKLHQNLPIADINYFKDMGFEFAGRTIHTIIKHMGEDDLPARSTQQPYFSDKTQLTTTEHAEVHYVKTSPDVSIITGEPETTSPATDSFKYHKRNRPHV